jgi:hypothetical protein
MRRIYRLAAVTATAVLPLIGVMGLTPASATLPVPVVVKGEGFDTSSLPPTSDMTTWWTATGYVAIGVYLGGENYIGSTPSHTWLANVMTTGWGVWLIWVGPQSACADQAGLGSFSNNAATAQAQGEAQANAAVAAARAVNFGDEYIVYDLEAFDTTNTACSTAAQMFINGWEYQIHKVDHEHGAVYGSSCGSDIAAFAGHSNVPEAIYPAEYGYSDDATTPLQCISSNEWDHNQRVHQWSGGSGMRIRGGYSAPSWTIDEDCLDGPAQDTRSRTLACT